jgi:hypothetical protein
MSKSQCQKRLSRIQRLAFLGIKGAMHITAAAAMEALTGPLLLDLLVQGEARSAAHQLCSLGL